MSEQVYLPLGSIVLLKGGTKRLMITGRGMKLQSTGEEYDYLGCPYPEGFISPEQTFVFNQGGIEEVIHFGYVDEEEAAMQEVLKEKRPLKVEA